MFSSIKRKLTIIYIILIALPLIFINYFSIESMTKTVLSEIEVNSLKTANIISNIYSSNINNPLLTKQSIKEYIGADAGRILVLHKDGLVKIDSANLIENTVVDNNETRLAYDNQEAIGYYYTDKYILQVAVPVTISSNYTSKASGVILVSTNVDKAFNDIFNFRDNLILISIIAAIIAVMVTMIISRHLSKPVIKLSKVAKSIGEGNLGETVNIKSNDEIGRLARDFNNMSRELYRIDQGRTQFIGDVSHELKSPLAAIKVLIDSLLYGEDDIEIYKEYLSDINTEVDRLAELINSLLDLTRIEEQGISADSHSLEETVQESVKILAPLANKYNVSIIVDFKNQQDIIYDKKWINMVLINLIDNAIKYRDDNKSEKYVKITGNKSNYGYELKIEDNGIGMDKKELDNVFEKFYRIDNSRSRQTGGAGIGLSIVNKVINQHGWNIEINSKPNQGSNFKIMIPNTSLNDSL